MLRRAETAPGADKPKRIESRTTEIDTRELAALIDGHAATSAPPPDLDAVIEVVEATTAARADDSKPVRAVLARGDKGVVVRAARPLPVPPSQVPEGSGAMQPTPPDGVAAQARQRTAPAPAQASATVPMPVQLEAVPPPVDDDPYKHTRPTTESQPLRRETEAEPEPVPARASGRLYLLLATLLLAASGAALFFALR